MNQQGGTDYRRKALTCNYCRIKKIKCSRNHPCENCKDHGEECFFPFVKRRVGTQRGKPRKDLEERLARMELLLELSNSTRLSSSEKAAITSVHREQQSQISSSTRPTEIQDPEHPSPFPGGLEDADKMMDGVGPVELDLPNDHSLFNSQRTPGIPHAFPPLSAGSLTQPQHQEHGSSSQGVQNSSQHVECADLLGSEVGWEYHGPTSFLSICSVPGISWVSESSGEPGFYETAKTLVLNIDSRLKMSREPRREFIEEPEEGVAWKWTQVYFEHSFDASLGLVSKEHFKARLRHHFAHQDMDDDPAWYALRNTIYASGCRLSSSNPPYSNTSGQTRGQAWRYFEKALSVHTELLYGSTGLMAVQALISMSFFAEGLGSPSLGYMLSSCATRLAQAKGLHRQPAQSWNLPQAEQQLRIRLFWTLYILEKHISHRSGRPSIIDDDDISCSFPGPGLDVLTEIDSFIYIVQHARISSRIAKHLASGKSFRQKPGKILEMIQQLNAELQEWRDSLPSLLQPDAPTTRHGKRPPNINMYHVMYLRYAYFGSIMAIHSIFTHPWNSALFGFGQTTALRNCISISSHVVVNAARSIILDTDTIHVDVSTPIWLAFYFPLVSAINILIYVLKYPALPTASSDVALLDIATGHFSRLELASPDVALPFVREITRLARATVERVKKTAPSLGSVLGPDLPESSITPNFQNTTPPREDAIELYSDNWGTMFSSFNDDSLDGFTFDYQ